MISRHHAPGAAINQTTKICHVIVLLMLQQVKIITNHDQL